RPTPIRWCSKSTWNPPATAGHPADTRNCGRPHLITPSFCGNWGSEVRRRAMGMLSKLLRRSDADPVLGEMEQAATVCLKLADEEIGSAQEREAISVLRDRLIRAVGQREVGEFDTLEFDDGFATVSFVGPNADRIAAVILPVVR